MPEISTLPVVTQIEANDNVLMVRGQEAVLLSNDSFVGQINNTCALTEATCKTYTDTAAANCKTYTDTAAANCKTYTDNAVVKKQDKLVAGSNITISGNVISATGGGGTSVKEVYIFNSVNDITYSQLISLKNDSIVIVDKHTYQLTQVGSGHAYAVLTQVRTNGIDFLEVYDDDTKKEYLKTYEELAVSAAIKSGAALGATAVQPETGKGLFSGSYNDLSNKLTAGDYISISDDNTISAAAQVFIATYGTTTIAEIKAAYDANKIILCSRNGISALDSGKRLLQLTYIKPVGDYAQAAFTSVSAEISADGTTDTRKVLYCICRADGWTTETKDLVRSYNDLADKPTDEVLLPLDTYLKGYTRYNTYATGSIFYVSTGSSNRIAAFDVEGVQVIGFEGVTSSTPATHWCMFYSGDTLADAINDGGTMSGSDTEIAPADKSKFTFVCASLDNKSSIPVPSGAKLFIIGTSYADFSGTAKGTYGEGTLRVYDKKMSIDGINGLIDARINGLEVQTAAILNLVGVTE